MQRYFGKEKINNEIILKEEDYHHIKNVLKLKENDNIIVNINNKSYLTKLNKYFKATIIKEEKTIDNLNIHLYVPILSDNKMSFIIEKSTELGVSEITPIMLEKCKFAIPKNKQQKKIERFKKIATSASMQCGRINIPKINEIITIKEVKKEQINILCSLDLDNVNKLSEVLKTYNSCDIITIVFGPEGGLTKKEEQILTEKGFIKTTLGNRVLRTETVPLFVLSIINFIKEE